MESKTTGRPIAVSQVLYTSVAIFAYSRWGCRLALTEVCASVVGVFLLRASEGKTVEIEYRGDVNDTVQDILGGLRSTCTYVGTQKLKELSRRTTFIRVTQQTNEIFK